MLEHKPAGRRGRHDPAEGLTRACGAAGSGHGWDAPIPVRRRALRHSSGRLQGSGRVPRTAKSGFQGLES